MIRRKLLVAAALVVSVVLSACADATGPTRTAAPTPASLCPVTSGSGIC